LPSDGGTLTIVGACSTDDRRIERQRVLGVRAVSTSAVARGAVTAAAGISVVARGAVTTATSVVTSVVARVVMTTTTVVIVIARRTLVFVAITAKISLVVPIVGADRRSLHGEDDGGEEECDGGLHILSIEKRV